MDVSRNALTNEVLQRRAIATLATQNEEDRSVVSVREWAILRRD